MRIDWTITTDDLRRLDDFRTALDQHPFVVRRRSRNVDRTARLSLTEAEIWRVLIGCLLTTQQPSGAGRPVDRFINRRPFLLQLDRCRAARSCEGFVLRELTRFGGIRRTNSIASEAAANLLWLESGGWREIRTLVRTMKSDADASVERDAAHTLAHHFAGIGPKQSRNLLQWLGLTRYEIPLDSRVVRWLNAFGFPVRLNAVALADPAYYEFILDGVQQLCAAAGLYPCELDAMIFAQNEPASWDGTRSRSRRKLTAR